MSKSYSINNYIFCKTPDMVRKIEANVNKGFATVAQKSGLLGLTVIKDAELSNGKKIPAGSTVYVIEEALYIAKKKPLTSPEHPEGFIMVLSNEIVSVQEAE